jgi:hypothetical protein
MHRQISLPLQAMEGGVEGPGAQPVTVTSQFLQHLNPVYRLPGCVIEYVDFNEAQKEILKHLKSLISLIDIAL